MYYITELADAPTINDDFALVTGSGKICSKADLLAEARSQSLITNARTIRSRPYASGATRR